MPFTLIVPDPTAAMAPPETAELVVTELIAWVESVKEKGV